MNINNNLHTKSVLTDTFGRGFEESVFTLTAADIRSKESDYKSKSFLPLLIRSILMAVSFGVFCYSIYLIASRIVEDRILQGAYDDIRPDLQAVSALERSTQLREPSKMPTLLEMLDFQGEIPEYEDEPINTEKFKDYRKSLLNLSAQYPDVYGWLVFKGTGIDYPIMQGIDNFYYLDHDYRGKEFKAGAIYADATLSKRHEENYNVIIYGHNMANGSMFRGIKLWYDKPNRNTLAQNMQIEVYTKDKVYIYELFSSYRSDDFVFDKPYFSDVDDYLNYLDLISKRSVLKKKLKFDAESKIVTLVTCTNVAANKDERYVVHGILRSVLPYNN